ncbi:MAG: OmpA family protein [Methylocystis sp.]|uniref:OmpA family protein n=1 Tax=Methylocystis sp. TaxID=1911079 RepID=UPI003D0A2F2A
MLAEIPHLWPWLLACFAIGVAAGASTRPAPNNSRIARWLVWSGLAFGVGVLVVRLGALDAAAAFVEGGLAAYAVFIVGAAIGALIRHGSLWAHEGWSVGLVAAALVWVGAIVIDRSHHDASRRDAALTNGAAPDTASAPSGRVDETPAAAPPPTKASIEAQAPGPQPTPAPSGMSLVDCQTALEDVASPSELVFRKGSARLTSSVSLALDKAAAVIRRCPEYATIEIRGHVRGSAAKAHNDALARRRVEAAINHLQGQGVGGRRLVASPQGSDQSESRALTFEVR